MPVTTDPTSASPAVASPAPAVPQFRGRVPRPLSFGTSGLRGLVTDITDLEAYVNTRGFLDYLQAAGDLPPGTLVAVAGDLRPSTDSPDRSILRAVVQAIRDAGREAVNCGRIPTPALMAHAVSQGLPSIMVTGSHIPFDRNGIKFNRRGGEVLKEEEAPILLAIETQRRAEYARPVADSLFSDDGMFRASLSPLPAPTPDARTAYIRRYTSFLPPGALAGLRIALYAHSAVGADVLAEILTALGADVLVLGRSTEFTAIDTEAISDDLLRKMQDLANEARQRVGSLHALVSTDGDSDRPMVLDVDPEGRARFFPGDRLGIVVADYLDADAVAVPVTATDAIERHLAGRGTRCVRTRVGSPHVIAAAEAMSGEFRRRVGWEANGGFFTFTDIERGGRTLAPLPTRDAVLPIVAALHASVEKRVPLRDLFAALPRRFGTAGLIDGVSPEAGAALVAALSSRPDLLRTVVTRQVGGHLGAITQLDVVDGVRVSFAAGEVIQIRASGNAPQLRLYALADSEERARLIVKAAIREPDGILRELLAESTR
jgi:phosphomannomutase